MSHPVPKDLKDEERILSIPFMDLYLSKIGIIYNGTVTIFSGIMLKLTSNVILFLILLLGLNILVYPLGQSTTKKSEFDGGNVRLDKFLKRKFSYRKKKRIYLRRKN